MREHSLLDTILEPGGLRAVFQPIFEIKHQARSLYAIESLIRGPRGTRMEQPDILFDYVRRKGEEAAVDRACIRTALAEMARLPQSVTLSLNVHASTLGRDRDFPDFLQETALSNSIATESLVIEIVEYAPFWDGPGFLAALDELRRMGVRIALDDIGLGQSNYRMILDCRPEYFKIDRYIVNNSHADPFRQAVLESVLLLARRFEARVVAEGVEQAEDFDFLSGIGIDLIQGYLLSLPLESQRLREVYFFDDQLWSGLKKAV
jgi:EAL domain-containing protein (putative c-di-GMP-specific phosphodiesterase class I)